MTMTTEQIKKFRMLLGYDNVRSTQPLHKRFVLEPNLIYTTEYTTEIKN
jgi:carbonic anhydrase